MAETRTLVERLRLNADSEGRTIAASLCVEEFKRAAGWVPEDGVDGVRVRFSVELL